MKSITNVIFALLILIVSCSNPSNTDYDDLHETMESLDIKEAVELANKWKYSNSEIISFITPTELNVIFPDKREIVKELPENEMYVAIAPYLNNTHSCSTHYLSSCQGELTYKEISLKVYNAQSEIISDERITTLRNGFFEKWLQRNQNFTFKLEYNNKKSEIVVQTYEKSKTCITDVKFE